MIMISCSKEKEVVKEKPVKPVKYAIVNKVGGDQEYSFTGVSRSSTQANLSFRTSGLVASVKVEVGQKVSKGQLLATLDPKDIKLNLDKMEATLNSSKAQKETAYSNLTRVKKLFQNNNVSLADYENAKNNYANTVSHYENALKSYRLQKRQMEYTLIRAPQDMVISAVNINENEMTQAGNPAIIANSGDQLELKVGIPETYINRIEKAQTVKIIFSSLKGKTFYGEVTEVSFTKEQNSGTYAVYVKINEATSEVRPGMTANVFFNISSDMPEGMLVVPVEAVGADNEGAFVYSIQKEKDTQDFKIKKVRIRTGKLLSGGFEVLSGIGEGERVCTAGLKTLYDGLKVKLLED